MCTQENRRIRQELQEMNPAPGSSEEALLKLLDLECQFYEWQMGPPQAHPFPRYEEAMALLTRIFNDESA